jgi:hypothetical protein
MAKPSSPLRLNFHRNRASRPDDVKGREVVNRLEETREAVHHCFKRSDVASYPLGSRHTSLVGRHRIAQEVRAVVRSVECDTAEDPRESMCLRRAGRVQCQRLQIELSGRHLRDVAASGCGNARPVGVQIVAGCDKRGGVEAVTAQRGVGVLPTHTVSCAEAQRFHPINGIRTRVSALRGPTAAWGGLAGLSPRRLAKTASEAAPNAAIGASSGGMLKDP